MNKGESHEADMAALQKHNAEVRVMIAKRGPNIVVECPLLEWEWEKKTVEEICP